MSKNHTTIDSSGRHPNISKLVYDDCKRFRECPRLNTGHVCCNQASFELLKQSEPDSGGVYNLTWLCVQLHTPKLLLRDTFLEFCCSEFEISVSVRLTYLLQAELEPKNIPGQTTSFHYVAL